MTKSKNIQNGPNLFVDVLAEVDPVLAERIQAKPHLLSEIKEKFPTEEIVSAYHMEKSLGKALFAGYLRLFETGEKKSIREYKYQVEKALAHGPTLARIFAEYLPSVLISREPVFLQGFENIIAVLQAKGLHTTKTPLETFSRLIENDETEAAKNFANLVADIFSENMTYSKTQHLLRIIPEAVNSFPASRKPWQIKALHRIFQSGIPLGYAFLKGMENGLYLLNEQGLNRFLEEGTKRLGKNENSVAKFISLESRAGFEAFSRLQVNISLSQIQKRIDRYLSVRLNNPPAVRPLSQAPKLSGNDTFFKTPVVSDGKTLYLSDEMNEFDKKDENIHIYLYLAKLEAGYFEFNTFFFDLEKMNPAFSCDKKNLEKHSALSDMERFFSAFSIYELARDLFTIFEHARLGLLQNRLYPGLCQNLKPILKKETERIRTLHLHHHPLFQLYLSVVFNTPFDPLVLKPEETDELQAVKTIYCDRVTKNPVVETVGEIVWTVYPKIEKLIKQSAAYQNREDGYIPVFFPFNRKLRPELVYQSFHTIEQSSRDIKNKLEEKNIQIFASDLKEKLIESGGILSTEDIQDLIYLREGKDNDPARLSPYDWGEVTRMFMQKNIAITRAQPLTGNVFHYPEWDFKSGEYLKEHVRLLEREIPPEKSDFYEHTLNRNYGLVKRIRKLFEWLKPEGLKRIRKWPDGDEFEYRSLIDYVVDRKAGVTPSDRLYIKRVKKKRDVAVLLLVDLSRSTSNPVAGERLERRVLDVEKEALVLFCEALNVVGDKYAIAGFSGTGRLNVDYFRIKDFEEGLNDNVKNRINALAWQRNTRMGAAIRHGCHRLSSVSAKVRLLILLGDGFPNDSDYKKEYAVEDTRKAVQETHAENIHFHGITVNMAAVSRLDNVYGKNRHTVISDVRELPDRLTGIYSSLTR